MKACVHINCAYVWELMCKYWWKLLRQQVILESKKNQYILKMGLSCLHGENRGRASSGVPVCARGNKAGMVRYYSKVAGKGHPCRFRKLRVNDRRRMRDALATAPKIVSMHHQDFVLFEAGVSSVLCPLTGEVS